MHFYNKLYKTFILLLITFLLISCENTTVTKDCTDNCNYVGEFNCVDGSTVSICRKDSNGCLVTSELTCDSGKTCQDGSCVNKCTPECGENSYCNNEKVCTCNEVSHNEKDSCMLNIKEVDCKDATPENAKAIIEKIEITWDDENNEWNTPSNCLWDCIENFHKKSLEGANKDLDLESCLANTKEVDCKDAAPENAEAINSQVTVNWNDETNTWDIPSDCNWKCVSGYHKSEDSCIIDEQCGDSSCSHGECNIVEGVVTCQCENGYIGDSCDSCADGYQDKDEDGVCKESCKDDSCTANNTICKDSSGTIQCVCDAGFQDNNNNGTCTNACTSGEYCTKEFTHCDDSDEVITCPCNDGTHLEGIACVSNTKEIPCDSSNVFGIPNSSYTSEDVTINWTTDWETTPDCEWSCEDGYIRGDYKCCPPRSTYNSTTDTCICSETGKSYNPNVNSCLLNECHISDDNKYLFCGIKKNRDDAKELCEDQGFYLVTINSADENNKIKSLITGDTWIGLNDIDTEAGNNKTSNNWKWVDGTSNTDINNGTNVNGGNSYWHWGGHEPNGGESDDCVKINNNGDWDDKKCDETKNFICERN